MVQKHAHEIYSEFFGCKKRKISLEKKLSFLAIAQNIDIVSTHCNRFIEAVLTSTHNLCFGSEIRQMSRRMGKPTICLGENKGADQLRGNREADQRLCFRFVFG